MAQEGCTDKMQRMGTSRDKKTNSKHQEEVHKWKTQMGWPQTAPLNTPSTKVLAFITKKKVKLPLTDIFPQPKNVFEECWTFFGLCLLSVCIPGVPQYRLIRKNWRYSPYSISSLNIHLFPSPLSCTWYRKVNTAHLEGGWCVCVGWWGGGWVGVSVDGWTCELPVCSWLIAT